jgi:chromosome segregation ATPase
MRVLKNLKSLFIVEATEGSPPEGVQPEKTAQAPVREEANHAPAPPVVPSGPDERFLSVLLSALEEHNVDGFDYLEYRESLRSLQSVPMDEATRFRSAYAMAQTLKADLTHLLRSGRVYLNVLDQEQKNFSEALEKRETIEIGGRQARMADLDQEVQRMQAEIEKLMAGITRARQEKETIEAELLASQQRMQETRDRFQASFGYLSGEIREDLQKMEQYIK